MGRGKLPLCSLACVCPADGAYSEDKTTWHQSGSLPALLKCNWRLTHAQFSDAALPLLRLHDLRWQPIISQTAPEREVPC